ncbi:M50 family metallopeptidase [Rarobacter incanus]|uniref:RIP metalloprotease RseP n=1 Tax=Rarobacter incanus TaxID=153494 RepID=A0A542SLD3_9MICO|nr:site-2 protease family protein [Rarobacter incanus]TQK75436.1 RIP metalloprotease RseP [Rarobacter incanus]
MSSVVGIIVIVVGVLASIALHEVGHMVPAKRFGVRVPQYFVGFGPRIWSLRRGETEYGIRAIPLGGYVRLVGMYPPADPDAKPRRGRIAALITNARAASMSEVLPGQEGRAFYNLAPWKKMIVMLGGPVMNLFIAIVLLTITQVGFGELALSTTIAQPAACITGTATSETAAGDCPSGQVAAPAYQAGLRAGDVIEAVGGTQTKTWDEVASSLQKLDSATVSLTVERDGALREVQVAPVTLSREQSDGTRTTRSYIGISPTYQWQPQSIATVPGVVWDQVAGTARIIIDLPQKVYQSAKAAFGHEERGTDAVVSVVGVGRIAGEITSMPTTNIPAQATWVSLAQLLAGLNIALFVFNLIPLVPLDGGHVAGAIYEMLKRALARARGKVVPRPADTARMVPVAYGMFFVLLAMGVVMIYADIVAPVQI